MLLGSTFKYLKSKYISIHFVEHNGMFPINLEMLMSYIFHVDYKSFAPVIYPWETNGKFWHFPRIATVYIDKPSIDPLLTH